MSVASDMLEQAADGLMAIHGDALTLQPMNVTAGGYAQTLDRDPESGGVRQYRLHIADDVSTHAVCILRRSLTNVTLKDIATITAPGTTKVYRVNHFRDDPLTSPEIIFFCTLG